LDFIIIFKYFLKSKYAKGIRKLGPLMLLFIMLMPGVELALPRKANLFLIFNGLYLIIIFSFLFYVYKKYTAYMDKLKKDKRDKK